jgi:hypothetical protein
MKLSSQENEQIASKLADTLIKNLGGVETAQELLPEQIINELVEMIDAIEDKVDRIIQNKLAQKPPKKQISEPWWTKKP